MIQFKKAITLTVVESFDEATEEIGEQSEVTFQAGEPVDACIIDEDGPFVQLEFGNGGVAFAVERELFDIVPG